MGLIPEADLFSSAYAHGDFTSPLQEYYQHRYPSDLEYSATPPVFLPGAGDHHGGEEEEEKKTRANSKKKARAIGGGRIGFRTRSEEVEILEDGFKWRKYGKKAVKNSPNPRNYYRCSAERCGVKKRVERDRDDPRFVVTTYDGVHNHATPVSAAAALRFYC